MRDVTHIWQGRVIQPEMSLRPVRVVTDDAWHSNDSHATATPDTPEETEAAEEADPAPDAHPRVH